VTSSIDICNRALSEVGARSSITSFDEGSTESLACLLWYDQCRQELLRAAPWGFARGQVVLSLLGSLTDDPPASPYPWNFKYLYPASCIKLRYLLPPTPTNPSNVMGLETAWGSYFRPSRNNRFIVANEDVIGGQRRTILSNLCQAQLVYVRDVTDVSLMDLAFQGALQALLSYRLVIPLSGNVGMRGEFKQAAMDAIAIAKAADGNEAMPTTDHTPDWIAARGVWVDNFMGGWGPGGPLAGDWLLGWDSVSWGS